MGSERREALMLVGIDPDGTAPTTPTWLEICKFNAADVIEQLIMVRDARGPMSGRHAAIAISKFEEAIMFCEKVFK